MNLLTEIDDFQGLIRSDLSNQKDEIWRSQHNEYAFTKILVISFLASIIIVGLNMIDKSLQTFNYNFGSLILIIVLLFLIIVFQTMESKVLLFFYPLFVGEIFDLDELRKKLWNTELLYQAVNNHTLVLQVSQKLRRNYNIKDRSKIIEYLILWRDDLDKIELAHLDIKYHEYILMAKDNLNVSIDQIKQELNRIFGVIEKIEDGSGMYAETDTHNDLDPMERHICLLNILLDDFNTIIKNQNGKEMIYTDILNTLVSFPKFSIIELYNLSQFNLFRANILLKKEIDIISNILSVRKRQILTSLKLYEEISYCLQYFDPKLIRVDAQYKLDQDEIIKNIERKISTNKAQIEKDLNGIIELNNRLVVF